MVGRGCGGSGSPSRRGSLEPSPRSGLVRRPSRPGPTQRVRRELRVGRAFHTAGNSGGSARGGRSPVSPADQLSAKDCARDRGTRAADASGRRSTRSSLRELGTSRAATAAAGVRHLTSPAAACTSVACRSRDASFVSRARAPCGLPRRAEQPTKARWVSFMQRSSAATLRNARRSGW